MIDDTIETLASAQHEIWAHWMKYLFSRCTEEESGGLTIPVEYVQRWRRQMQENYAALSEKEKESDRHQAKKVLAALDRVGQPPAQSQSEISIAAMPDFHGISGTEFRKRSA